MGLPFLKCSVNRENNDYSIENNDGIYASYKRSPFSYLISEQG